MSEALDHMAARITDDPLFLANPLAEYARSESLTDAALASTLGCSMNDLTPLRLCRAPRSGPGEFRADIAAIATRFGIDPGTLANAVRRGQALATLRQAHLGNDQPGFLLAARDEDQDPPKPEEPPT